MFHRLYHARLRAWGVQGPLPPALGFWNGLRLRQGSKGVWEATKPRNFKAIIKFVPLQNPGQIYECS